MSYTLTDLAKEIILQSHPVGSYLFTSNSADPSTYMGGVWEQVKGRFLYALEDGQSVGETGGEKSHTLTTAETPSHTHGASETAAGDHWHYVGIFNQNNTIYTETYAGHGYLKSGVLQWTSGTVGTAGSMWSGVGTGDPAGCTSITGGHTHTLTIGSTGGGSAHNNMPPYLAVYVFKRIS
jgi:microcystin-dependent protein